MRKDKKTMKLEYFFSYSWAVFGKHPEVQNTFIRCPKKITYYKQIEDIQNLIASGRTETGKATIISYAFLRRRAL